MDPVGWCLVGMLRRLAEATLKTYCARFEICQSDIRGERAAMECGGIPWWRGVFRFPRMAARANQREARVICINTKLCLGDAGGFTGDYAAWC